MSVSVTLNGTSYTIPQTGETGWGTQVTTWIQAVSNSCLQKTGGNFTLTAEVNFGSSYGLKAPYYKSSSADLASSGQIRLANADAIKFRNSANAADLSLNPKTSADGILQFSGVDLVDVSTAQTLTNKTLTAPVISSPTGLTKSDVGLSNVDNTSDATKDAAATSLTNKTIDADLNTITNIENADIKAAAGIVYSKLNLATSIVDGDVAAAAAIARTKLASGTASHVLVNDGSGVMSSVSKLPETQGGTNQSTYTTGDLLFASGSNTLSKLPIGSTGQALTVAGGLPAWGTGGGGGGTGLNFVGLNSSWSPSDTTDRDAESSVGNWAAYADAASSIPTDMTGGSPSVTITRTTTAGQILNGTASFLITKGASNLQGQGASCVFNVPPAYQGKVASIQIPFKIVSGSLVQGDLKVFIYDVTNSVVITPYNNDVIGNSGTILATFPVTASASTPANIQMRVGFHFASTSTTAVTVAFDDVQVGPQVSAIAPAMSDWVEDASGVTFEGTSSNPVKNGSPVIDKLYRRRVGDSLEVKYFYSQSSVGTAGSGSLLIKIPNGLVIDTAKLNVANTGATASLPERIVGGGLRSNNDHNSGANVTFLALYDSTHLKVMNQDAAANRDPESATVLGNANLTHNGSFTVPIVGWSSNITVGQSSTFNISSYLANGTRVTGSAPTQLGQYRSYLRNSAASTFTETNGSPTISPTSTDGVALYTGNAYSSADTNNQPTRYDIFVGKNKNVKLQSYASTGKTGVIDITPISNTGGNNSKGSFTNYDPSTGIFTIFPFYLGAETAHFNGYDSAGAVSGTTYFDIVVSENALAVGTDQVRSQVYVTGYNGYGATNTKILRFDTLQESLGNAITYADSSTLGASFTINEDGVYSMFINSETSATALWIGISLNSTQLSTSIESVTYANGNRGMGYSENNVAVNLSRTLVLRAGDVVRFHTGGTAIFDSPYTQASITKVSN